MLERCPIDQSTLAQGAIQSEADPCLCIDATIATTNQIAKLKKCSQDLTKPDTNRDFELSWHRHIKKNGYYEYYIDTYQTSLIQCHYGSGINFGSMILWENILIRFRKLNYKKFTRELISLSTHLMAALRPSFLRNHWKWKNVQITTSYINHKWHLGFTNVTTLENWKNLRCKTSLIDFCKFYLNFW